MEPAPAGQSTHPGFEKRVRRQILAQLALETLADLKREIGRKIRMLREARTAPAVRRGQPKRRLARMTIEELAERTGLSADYLNKVELGRHEPSADTLLRVARALEVDVGDLFPTEGPPHGHGEKRRAIDQLVSFVAQFPSTEIQYLLRVAQVVMDRPSAKVASSAKYPP